jgi:hypothetical protein
MNLTRNNEILYGNYNYQDYENKKFVDCGIDLAKILRNNLPSVFDEKFYRKFPTIWISWLLQS